MRSSLLFCLAVFLVSLASACTTTEVLKPIGAKTLDASGARVLLLPPDVEVSELLASGMTEPRADWTATARAHIATALNARVSRAQAGVVAGDPSLFAAESPHLQVLKLHEAVGSAILVNKLGAAPLPTLRDRFDFTLGTSVKALAADTGANYALFVYVRDSYASGGRQALIAGGVAACVASMGLFCVIPSGGIQVGFASLVDLETGEIVWFNRLVSHTGDVREAGPADETLGELLEESPL